MTTGTDAAAFRDASLRTAGHRLAVVGALRHNPGADVDTIVRAVVRRVGPVSLQVVDDVLGALDDAGLLRRIGPADAPARFELRVETAGDPRHRLVCRGCGVTVEVDCAVAEPRCVPAGDLKGFAVDRAEIIYRGFCPACRATRAARGETGGGGPTPR